MRPTMMRSLRKLKLRSVYSAATILITLYVSHSALLVLADDQSEGEKAAMAVLKGIRGKLTEEMAKDLVKSVEFCHESAIPLTEKYWQEYRRVTSVKRTSLKIRNPKNKPDSYEKKLLLTWQKMKKEGRPLPPFHLETISSDEVRYYKPLTIEAMCLTCHGQPSGDLAKTIQLKYPMDKAIGYKEGDFRGLIRISLKPEKISQPPK